MGFGRYIKNKIRQFLREDNGIDDCMPSPIRKSSGSTIGRNSMTSLSPMTFTMYNASGGKVIEFNSYDAKTDKGKTSLYVIHDEDELAEEITQILTKESLCR